MKETNNAFWRHTTRRTIKDKTNNKSKMYYASLVKEHGSKLK